MAKKAPGKQKISKNGNIGNLLKENRVFKPSTTFTKQAHARTRGIYKTAESEPVKFWEKMAGELVWKKKWRTGLSWNPPDAKWFVGGKLNVTESLLDRHLTGRARNKAAIIWEGEPGDKRTITYYELYRQVNKFANVLKHFGIKKGDRVAIYLPMIPELIVAMLACARIGAIHSIVFGGFSPEFLRDRINDAQATMLITADGSFRRGQILPLKHDADIGWITGHSYITYGPLANAATQIMYEGAPDWPDQDRFWQIVEDNGVTIFYTAPTAIRSFMKWGRQWPDKHDLNSLRLLGTVGEPINPEAWMWYHDVIGGKKCPIVDTWWQTETGHIMITPLPGLTPTKPGSATRPFPGIEAAIVDENGRPTSNGGGYLTVTKPWPGMLRGIWGDRKRYVDTYWSKWPGMYFPGDGAKIDADKYFWILGRIDDELNISGHRISTMEVESTLVAHPNVTEAATVGIPHELKGQCLAAFVTLGNDVEITDRLIGNLKDFVVRKIGAIARPERIIFTPDLPKTRSGKIMRRLLRDIAMGKVMGDTTTLADPDVLIRIKKRYEED